MLRLRKQNTRVDPVLLIRQHLHFNPRSLDSYSFDVISAMDDVNLPFHRQPRNVLSHVLTFENKVNHTDSDDMVDIGEIYSSVGSASSSPAFGFVMSQSTWCCIVRVRVRVISNNIIFTKTSFMIIERTPPGHLSMPLLLSLQAVVFVVIDG